jgi:hypothetical protein
LFGSVQGAVQVSPVAAESAQALAGRMQLSIPIVQAQKPPLFGNVQGAVQVSPVAVESVQVVGVGEQYKEPLPSGTVPPPPPPPAPPAPPPNGRKQEQVLLPYTQPIGAPVPDEAGSVQVSPVMGVGESGGHDGSFVGAPAESAPPVDESRPPLECPPLAVPLPALEALLPALEVLLPACAPTLPAAPPLGELLDPPHAAESTPPTNNETIPNFNVFILGS